MKFPPRAFSRPISSPRGSVHLVLHVQRHATINTTTVQQLAKVSKHMATRYLTELKKAGYLQRTGTMGVGPEYPLKGT